MPARIPYWILEFTQSNLGVLVGFLAAYMQIQEYLKDPISMSDTQARFQETYDFIVIGGGSAGSAVAARLSESPFVSTLLIEAGGDPNPVTLVPAAAPMQIHASIAFEYRTVPQNGSALASRNQEVLWPRGRGLGGSSNLNFMTYNRGNPNDFDQWAVLTGDPRWSFKSVLRYFLKLEDYHGYWDDGLGNGGYHNKGGPLRVERLRYAPGSGVRNVLKAAEELGYSLRDPNAIQTPGFSPIDFTQKRGTRFSTYRAYIKPFEFRNNFKISRYSQATKIHFDHELRAVGVTYMKHGFKHYVTAKKEIILSCGSIASPQLLMLSGIGPKEHLAELGIPTLLNLPVGQNLYDHVLTFVGPFLLNQKGSSFIPERDLTYDSIGEYLTKGTGPLTVPMGASVFGQTSTRHTIPSWPNILWSVHTLGVHRGLGSSLDQAFNTNSTVFQDWLRKYEGRDAHFMMQVMGLPKSVGYLRLVNRDIDTFPEINPRYYSDPERNDIEGMIDGIEEFIKLYENTTYLGKEMGARLIPEKMPGCEHYKHRSRNYWECVARTATATLYHPTGTCRMGHIEDPRSVLDPQLRVIGTKGLRVADCSVMPQITNTNTNAPAIMIGEMCADFVKETWGLLI